MQSVVTCWNSTTSLGMKEVTLAKIFFGVLMRTTVWRSNNSEVVLRSPHEDYSMAKKNRGYGHYARGNPGRRRRWAYKKKNGEEAHASKKLNINKLDGT